jgi:nitric oxide reductase NorD protein
LSLDEFLFKSISNYKRRSKERKLKQQTTVVWLDQIKPRLILVARALTGSEIEIFTAEREGGYKNHNFFFPEYCNLFPEKVKNEQFYLYRTLYLAIQWQLQAKLAT